MKLLSLEEYYKKDYSVTILLFKLLISILGMHIQYDNLLF